ncbi:MAG: RelA/SpoT family protein [Oscillospiraceae bacterium]|jgi:GTP pyrophosphokinase|nr:RelA/SpoT family protein [Oscillospiraceae bacterium]
MIEAYREFRARCESLRWPDSDKPLDSVKPVFSQEELEALDRAYAFADRAHAGEERLSGEPYIIHPVAVAQLLLDLGFYDHLCLVAALLHDVAEDTAYGLEDIQKRFGPAAAQMVDGLTKLNRMNFASSEQAEAQNVLKMLLSMLRDYRVILVKLADRLHNMRTLEHKNREGQLRIARETMYVYVPIADMLGIRLFKEELEDIAIRFLDPHGYAEIETWLARDRELRGAFLESIQARLRDFLQGKFRELYGRDAPVHVEGRVKSVHGIYRKHHAQLRSFEEIFDVYAVRIIVNTVEECYLAFSWVQQIYHSIPGRIKDRISNPKQNGYQSLHLTMVGAEKIPFEVQIRTWDMHYIAETGVAAHWKYKLGIAAKDVGMEDRLAKVQELLDSYKDADSVEEVVQSIRSDIAPLEKVYPMTPKGETKELKLGATVLDFAYAVHTKVGHRFRGAKANGRIAPIEYQVQSGDVVEILLDPNPDKGPSRDWKHIAVTSQAQSKIRAWFKKERREENIAEGKREMDAELRRSFSRLEPGEREDILLKALARKHFGAEGLEGRARLEEFYAALGYGGVTIDSYLPLLREEYQKLIKAQQEIALKKITSDKGVVVEGVDNCQVKFAQCCHPVPGDAIIGYITRGSDRGGGGVTIHRAGCSNVPADAAGAPEPDRWLRARWDRTEGERYKGALVIKTLRRASVAAEVTGLLNSLHIPLSKFTFDMHDDGTGTIVAVAGVASREQLKTLRDRIAAIKGVGEVYYG